MEGVGVAGRFEGVDLQAPPLLAKCSELKLTTGYDRTPDMSQANGFGIWGFKGESTG